MTLINNLREMNFSEAEAKIYIMLLRHGKSTGYEISKQSGVARSKVYNHLEDLVEEGILELANEGKTSYYKAISPDELIKLKRKSLDDSLRSFKDLSLKLGEISQETGVWEITNYDRVILKALDLIESAQESIYIQLWAEDLTSDLVLAINERIDNLDKSVIILYDGQQAYKTGLKKYFRHGFEMESLEDMQHRWITIVADDEEFLYSGFLFNQEASGLYAKNKIISFFAREYVKHDAYCLKLIDKFREQLVAEYGQGMEEVRNIFD